MATTKITGLAVLHNQKFITSRSEVHNHADIVLDPGCSQFGKLLPRPFKQTVRVMYDFGLRAWIVAEI